MNWQNFRETFDTYLETHLLHQLEQVQPYIFCDELRNIYDFLIPYSRGGKRIRPYLVYLLYKITGGKNDALAYQVGIVNELIHLFALIHDDINDKWTIRHNLPCFHTFAAKQLGDDYQWINIGILIGDVLMSRAYQHLHALDIPGKTKSIYFEMLNTTMYGQIQDVYLSHTTTLYSKDIIAQKDKAKSGNYSFMRPMVIGCSLNEWIDTAPIQQLGERLGLAFQMRDDLLDIIDGHGNKTVFSDHQEGNQTYLLAHAFETATPEQQAYLLETRGKVCDAPTKQRLLDIYTTTWTIQRAGDEINKQLANCSQEVTDRAERTPEVQKEYIASLQEIITFLTIA